MRWARFRASGEVDVDDASEVGELVRPALTHGLLADDDAGAIDNAEHLAHRSGLSHRGLALVDLQVGDDDLATASREYARRALAKSGRAAGDDKNLARDEMSVVAACC